MRGVRKKFFAVTLQRTRSPSSIWIAMAGRPGGICSAASDGAEPDHLPPALCPPTRKLGNSLEARPFPPVNSIHGELAGAPVPAIHSSAATAKTSKMGESVLPSSDIGFGRTTVLSKKEPTAWLKHPPNLGRCFSGVIYAAQGEGHRHSVDASVIERQSFARTAKKFNGSSHLARALLCEMQQFQRRI